MIMRNRRWGVLALWVVLAGAGSAAAREQLPDVEWSVKPDVPVAATMPSTAPATTTAPAGGASTNPVLSWAKGDGIKPDLSLVVRLRGGRDVVVPTRPSRFVLSVGGSGDWGWGLWDLHLGSKVRSGTGQVDMENLALSPDGQYLAGSPRGNPTEGGGIEVWSLKNMKRLSRIDTDTKAFGPKIVGFANPERILIYDWKNGGEYLVEVHDIATGEKKAQISVPGSAAADVLVLSANGVYLAVPESDRVAFYDTSNGVLCGSVPLGSERYQGLAFSRDGREMTVLTQGQGAGEVHLAVYDVASAKLLGEASVYMESKSVGSRRNDNQHGLSYLPDGSGWLIHGHTVVSRTLMGVIYEFPYLDKETDAIFCRMASGEQLFEIVKGVDLLRFQTMNMPKDVAAKTAIALKAGGTWEDADKPPLARAEVSAAAFVSLDGIMAAPWVVRVPAAAPAPGRRSVAVVPLRATPSAAAGADVMARRGPARAPDEELTCVLFTSREANGVLVERALLEPATDGSLQRTMGVVEKYDLAGGTVQATLQVLSGMQLEDVSPSGNMLALRGGREQDRLDLMIMDKGTYKPFAAFRPYQAEPEAPVMNSARYGTTALDSVHRIDAAACLDDSHVLTASSMGVLMCWEVPACKALWQARFIGMARRRDRSLRMVMSPDRKLVAIAAADGLVIFETLTGRALNALPASEDEVFVETLAFAPDGQRLGAVVHASGVRRLQVYDLATGVTTADVPLPQKMGAIEAPAIRRENYSTLLFPAPGYVLVGAKLVSLEKHAMVWQYSAEGMEPIGGMMPGEGAWFVVPRTAKTPAALVHVAVPHEAAKKAVGKLEAQELYDWCPGMKVALKITVIGDERYRLGEVARWTEGLKARGIVVADDAANVLTATTSLVGGTPVEYSHGMGAEKFSVTPQTTTHSIQLTVAGKEVWKHAPPTAAPSAPRTQWLVLQEGESLQQAANRLNPAPSQASDIVLPPEYILKERTIDSSKIGLKGVEDMPGANTRPQ